MLKGARNLESLEWDNSALCYFGGKDADSGTEGMCTLSLGRRLLIIHFVRTVRN